MFRARRDSPYWLIGKTIKRAEEVTNRWESDNERLGLLFTDGTHCVISSELDHDGAELVLYVDADDFEQLQMGIISQQEYDRRLSYKERRKAREQQEQEIAELQRLKEKYEG